MTGAASQMLACGCAVHAHTTLSAGHSSHEPFSAAIATVFIALIHLPNLGPVLATHCPHCLVMVLLLAC